MSYLVGFFTYGAMSLNPKQERFVNEYLIDLNAIKAADRAGYSFDVVGGFYVYFLIDPRDSKIFYVGKGKGNRYKDHAKAVTTGKIDNAEKCSVIADIREAGLKVVEEVFAAGLGESDAYDAERTLIELLRNHGLTNIAGGVVTNERRAQQMARAGLARLKTFEEWIATATSGQMAAAKLIAGSARAFDNMIRGEYLQIIEGRY